MFDLEMLKYIEASFKHGKIFSDGERRLVKIVLIVVLVCTLLLVMIFIIMLFAEDAEPYMIILCAVIFAGLVAFDVFLFYITKKMQKQKNEILLCLEDAVETYAKVARLDVYGAQFAPYQVQADFKIGDIEFHKISLPGNALSGYHKVFAKYHDQKVKILFSPKYDTVLVLKPGPSKTM